MNKDDLKELKRILAQYYYTTDEVRQICNYCKDKDLDMNLVLSKLSGRTHLLAGLMRKGICIDEVVAILNKYYEQYPDSNVIDVIGCL